MPKVLRMFREPKRNRKFQRGVYLLPGMFTVANMFCGWACVVYSMRGEFFTAAPLVAIAMVLDTLDGRIARMTGATSEFGEEFDSLADIVSFGVAPAVLVFSWGLESLGRLGWAVGFLYITAAAIRLARFNIHGKSDDKRFFVGLPSPTAAGMIAATVFAFPSGLNQVTHALAGLPLVLVPAGLMVSRLRFRSFGALIPGARQPSLSLLFIAGVIGAIAIQPQVVLFMMAYTYVSFGVVAHVLFRGRSWSSATKGSHEESSNRGKPDLDDLSKVAR
ncbi:CDP-diacylglycerol--serine O-phosphatidyltransferase [Myxococcota bacterium]|nr:CDP-diacylglycerol--serine O-phosphatidyltransferase [Myxococcota bacterium]